MLAGSDEAGTEIERLQSQLALFGSVASDLTLRRRSAPSRRRHYSSIPRPRWRVGRSAPA